MTTFINEILGKLFPVKKSPIKIKENFSISEIEKREIENWMLSSEFEQFLDLIHKNISLKKAGVEESPEVHLLNSPYANGIAISFGHSFTAIQFNQLFFAFGKLTLDLGYTQISLDRKTEEMEDDVKITEKQYFKPPMSNNTFSEKIDQLYGNVSIEKVSINAKPDYLKILVTVYSDQLYEEAKPFDQYIERLFRR